MCFSFSCEAAGMGLRWRLAKTGCVALNPPALVVTKATASSPCETPSVFFEGLNAPRRGLFYASPLFEATVRLYLKGEGRYSGNPARQRLCRRGGAGRL